MCQLLLAYAPLKAQLFDSLCQHKQSSIGLHFAESEAGDSLRPPTTVWLTIEGIFMVCFRLAGRAGAGNTNAFLGFLRAAATWFVALFRIAFPFMPEKLVERDSEDGERCGVVIHG